MDMNDCSMPLEQLQAATQTIRNHPHLQQRNLKVASSKGKLLIHGQVPSYFEKQMAQEALRPFEHLAVIENAIEVRWF